jgi:hypothetical protein
MGKLTDGVRDLLRGTRPATGLTLDDLAQLGASRRRVQNALLDLQDGDEARFSWRQRYYAGDWLRGEDPAKGG